MLEVQVLAEELGDAWPLTVAFDRDADADALVSEVEQTLAAIASPSASATD